MKSYVVTIESVIEGRFRATGDVVELTDERAKNYIEAELVISSEMAEKRATAAAAKAGAAKAEK